MIFYDYIKIMPYFIMHGGSVFTHIEKDKFLVTNTGDGKDINNTVVKLVLKDLKEILSSYGVDTKKKKKQELLEDFIKLSKNMKIEPKPVPPKKSRSKKVAKPIKFEAMEEMMMDTTPKSKNIQIKKPFRLSPELERAADPARLSELLPIRSDREDELLKMEEDELTDIINDNEIKFKGKNKRAMIDAILKKENIVKGTVLPEDVYEELVQQHRNLSLKNSRGDRSLYVLYRALEDKKNKLAQKRKKPLSERDTSQEYFDEFGKSGIKGIKQRISDAEQNLLKTITKGTKGIKGKKGGSISAKDLKGLHASSYKEVPDKEVNGWVLDEDISKPTARVYFNASKNQAIVVHRGTEATVKDWANNLAYVTGTNKLTGRYKDAERVQKRAEEKYPDLLTTGHSQGGIYTKIAKDQSKVINVNPASMGETTSGTTIRSKNDPVSALAGLTGLFKKNDKNITTSAQANPLAAHSIDILDELGDKELGGSLTKYLKGLHGKKGTASSIVGRGIKRMVRDTIRKFYLKFTLPSRLLSDDDIEDLALTSNNIDEVLEQVRTLFINKAREFDQRIQALHAEQRGLNRMYERSRYAQTVREIEEIKAQIETLQYEYVGLKKALKLQKSVAGAEEIIEADVYVPSRLQQRLQNMQGPDTMRPNMPQASKVQAVPKVDIEDQDLQRAIQASLSGSGKFNKKGKGRFEDFFKKTLPRALVKQGIPILGSVAGTALGSIAGPISGAVGAEVGSKAGEVLSKYVSDKAGLGLTRRLQALGR
jgi:hypothetical protein